MINEVDILTYPFKNNTELDVYEELLKLPQPLFIALLDLLIHGEINYTFFTPSILDNLTRQTELFESVINNHITNELSFYKHSFNRLLIDEFITNRLSGRSNYIHIIPNIESKRADFLTNYNRLSQATTDLLLGEYANCNILTSIVGDASKISISRDESLDITRSGISYTEYIKNKQIDLLALTKR